MLLRLLRPAARRLLALGLGDGRLLLLQLRLEADQLFLEGQALVLEDEALVLQLLHFHGVARGRRLLLPALQLLHLVHQVEQRGLFHAASGLPCVLGAGHLEELHEVVQLPGNSPDIPVELALASLGRSLLRQLRCFHLRAHALRDDVLLLLRDLLQLAPAARHLLRPPPGDLRPVLLAQVPHLRPQGGEVLLRRAHPPALELLGEAGGRGGLLFQGFLARPQGVLLFLKRSEPLGRRGHNVVQLLLCH